MVTTILSDFFSFDFSKAFDSVSHNILCSKLKQVSTNPYSVNWLISFFRSAEKAESCCRWLPYGICFCKWGCSSRSDTVLGPVLSSIFINDIKAVNTNKNLLVKCAGDITVSLPIEPNVGLNDSETEVLSFIEWSEIPHES